MNKNNSYINKKITRADIISLVDKAADLLRNLNYETYILVFIFLKKLNDEWKLKKESFKRRILETRKNISEDMAEKIAESQAPYKFKIPEDCRWDKIFQDVKNLSQRLSYAVTKIARLNNELDGVINDPKFLEFIEKEENKPILIQIMQLLDKYDLSSENVSSDVLGDVYEHIIMKFAQFRGKQGEIYTPREVIKLMVKILDPKPEEEVYDPCCGTGGMLIVSYNYVQEKYGTSMANRLLLYGQERNPSIYALCKMNLLIHGIENFKIESGDTLDSPKFKESKKNELKKFDVILANIPWNQDGYNEERLRNAEYAERFQFGYTPHQSADWAWLQHILFSLKEKTGRAAVIVDNGCLFRGGKEKVIRTKFVENDFIEGIILLPEKLFYNTGAPGVIIILRKNKPQERRGKILFINASQEYEKHPEVRRLNRLGDAHIDKIVNVYKNFKEVPGFSKIVSLEEIRKNDYNLNVTLYVFPEEKEEEIDVKKEWEEINKLEEELKQLTSKISSIVKQLG